MNPAERSTNGLLELYQDHIQQVTELQHLVQQQYPPSHQHHDVATSYLNDRITLFRFLKKANYVLPEAYNLVEANVAWRLAMGCDRITPRDLQKNPLWTNNLVHLRGQDRYGHPLIVIRLGQYISAPQQSQQEDDGEEEEDRFLEYKRYIIFVLECTRKLLWESSRRQPTEEHSLQATLILDLQGASVSDLDHQLITYTIDLLKHRYPSCLAQVYVLNYSWVFGGIWQMLKRALPESARARVSFPSSTDELWEHFDREDLSTGLNPNT
ncbi:MAG: CRAL-TRIO domain-containing protein [Linnemannia elongata]|nr:MAG: CRAL-TRIO domain-containing protein [Linnemannia elongata]